MIHLFQAEGVEREEVQSALESKQPTGKKFGINFKCSLGFLFLLMEALILLSKSIEQNPFFEGKTSGLLL